MLYQAARAQFVEQVIKPRLAMGEIVLSDRYYDSTIAYQGYGHQQDLEQVRALVRYATGGLVPDLTILLDVDVEVGLKRKQKADEWNRLDAYTVDFHRRVRAGYLEMVKQEPVRWRVVDAGREWKSVQEELRKVILEKFGENKMSEEYPKTKTELFSHISANGLAPWTGRETGREANDHARRGRLVSQGQSRPLTEWMNILLGYHMDKRPSTRGDRASRLKSPWSGTSTRSIKSFWSETEVVLWRMYWAS